MDRQEMLFERAPRPTDPEAAAKEVKLIKEAYRIFEQSESGKLVLKDLIDSHMMVSSFVGDPYSTAYREGQRSVVLGIIRMLESLDQPEPDTQAEEETDNG